MPNFLGFWFRVILKDHSFYTGTIKIVPQKYFDMYPLEKVQLANIKKNDKDDQSADEATQQAVTEGA